jgi:hypothetical protein
MQQSKKKRREDDKRKTEKKSVYTLGGGCGGCGFVDATGDVGYLVATGREVMTSEEFVYRWLFAKTKSRFG